MNSLIAAMHALPPELISLAMIAAAYGGVLVLMRFFGLSGLIAFVVVAVLGANIQVMKVAQFSVFQSPVALGTELFASTYLAIDIIAENYGPDQARRTIWIGFASQVLFTILMILTLGYAPVTGGGLEDAARNHGVEQALTTILQPQAGLLVAGLASYLVSQHLDVSIFAWLKRETQGRMLWLRNGASNIGAALVDNTIFSVLAWEVFSPNPIPLNTLIFTYILGTFYIRVFVSLLDTPFMYLSRKLYRQRERAMPMAEAGR